MTQIGFIGLGIMGRGMTRNLLKAGRDVTVWNRTAARMDEFVAEGAKSASSPADLASRCDVILICVSDTPDVEQVLFGADGVSAGVKRGALVADHSTISPRKTVEMAKRLNAQGAAFLDAPVSGGSEGAKNGTLSIMVGGAASDFERALPILQAYGKTVTHVGAQGAGQTAKLVNQILVVVNQLAASEALLFAQAGGLDLATTIDAVKGGAAGSWMLANRGPQMIVRDFRPGFTIDLQQKDLRLVLEAADEMGIPLLATGMVFQMYRALQAQGLGGEGNHSLVKALEKMMGVELGKK
ncbi:MAG: NAD(P)-dependent oxidoreductase [Anaerolineae bacterium CFX3]|jgi:3-hydroxyisobutyrate dehydrogenase|nr:2-hydroxy-3-oxopropionate reductase [Anaerolineales bacterium]MCE7906325.1 NAD(P)-dependent oxidoreductase [Anaerolineae bacterium CFX3]MCQ3947081.1 2-hydroxy-3-oxopropionate reductase [Anaerolineae bacterium]OQY84157.1 MAG: 2-hydroxy-3-oxopropionate reductase [Anaerolineae bacterium UTCFX3]MBW7918077.1 NAD(P)-dependent oxidoreductase [Anaerolineales bacterium]